MIIKAYEINYKFINIFKKLFPLELYPNITFLSKNFLTANEKESFPIIFCNPPFTKGGDSYYYINFFFECCKISKQSNTGIENIIYFISPPLIDDKLEKDKNIDPYTALHSKFLNKKRIEEILNKNIDTKEYNKYKKNDNDNIIDEIMEDKYEPNQIYILDNVKFKGTNFPAYLYEILIINEQFGKGKPTNQKLYNQIKDKIYSENPKHSLFRSAILVKEYKDKGGEYDDETKPDMNINKWFEQNWISLNDYYHNKSKVPCGSSDTMAKYGTYPLCRPIKIAESLTKEQIKKLIDEKDKLKEKHLITKKILGTNEFNIKSTKSGMINK